MLDRPDWAAERRERLVSDLPEQQEHQRQGRGGADLSRPFPPVTPPLIYNESWRGVFGEFGSGAGLQAMYVQTAISPAELEKIWLLEDIPGSERWPVRDLFQREVDLDRVTGSLMNYLESQDRIRFFNPLTLTILPMDRRGRGVLRRMARIVDGSMEDAGHTWRTLERRDFYRIRWVEGHRESALLEWNERRSRIVAIDGQHRLSALKRIERRPKEDAFFDWRIPIVVVSFRTNEGRAEPPGVLEVVRSIFVDINTEAREVNEARQVLLNDKSVNCVAAQELLDHAHSNDLRNGPERRRESVPLLFFDWRGHEQDGKPVVSRAAVKSIGEARSWFEFYILGEDYCDYQRETLDIGNAPPTLKAAFGRQMLTFDASKRMRDRLGKQVLPALFCLLEGFEPYRRYIEGLRDLEDKYYCGSDLQHHAFDSLRFGNSYAIEANRAQVSELAGSLEVEIEKLKRACLPSWVRDDLGMRGVVQAFGHLIWEFGCSNWVEYAEWFTENLNFAFLEGWFDDRPGRKGHTFLRHVIEDHNGTVANYRLQDAQKALGPYVGLLVGTYGEPPESWQAGWPSVRVSLLDSLEGTLVRGYKKELRPALKEEYPAGGRELNLAVKREAEKSAGRQMRCFEREMEKVARSVR